MNGNVNHCGAVKRSKTSNALKLATVFAIAATLSACKSDKLPTFPTSTPTSIPVPTTGGIPSPSSSPSLPSPPSGSPPSSPGSSGKSGKPSPSSSPPSSPSSGPSGPSMPSPGLPDLSGKPGGSSGDSSKSRSKPSGQQQGGQPGSDSQWPQESESGSQRESQTAAGEDLQKAGERIAKSGAEEVDPLIPTVEWGNESDGEIFVEPSHDTASGSNGDPASDAAEGGPNSDVAGQGGEPMGSQESGDGQAGSELPAELEDEIRRAQEALAKAGEALQEAGAAVANAETDDELAAAEDLLGDARIAVIVATQGVEMIEDDLSKMPDFGGSANEDIFQDTTAALQDANIALVIATRSILIAKNGSAEFPTDATSGGAQGNSEVAALEDELDEALVIFDGQVGAARDAVLTSAPPPETAGTGPRRSGEGSKGVPTSEQGELMGLPAETTEDQPQEQQVATAEMPNLNQGDIPDAQGDDIVATQLREAALSESDPALQAKLWEEYKRYKEGL